MPFMNMGRLICDRSLRRQMVARGSGRSTRALETVREDVGRPHCFHAEEKPRPELFETDLVTMLDEVGDYPKRARRFPVLEVNVKTIHFRVVPR